MMEGWTTSVPFILSEFSYSRSVNLLEQVHWQEIFVERTLWVFFSCNKQKKQFLRMERFKKEGL
jgi:hypothetical protein